MKNRSSATQQSIDTITVNPQIAYLAAAWALAFAAISFYWAFGGEIGSRTIAHDIDEIPLANNSLFVAATGVIKVLSCLIPLFLVWGRGPRRLLMLAIWTIGGLLALYGVADLINHGLMLSGAISTPDVLGSRAAHWHFFLWDPVWIVGGLLYLATAYSTRRRR